MLRGECELCGATGALGTFKGVDQKLCCANCTRRQVDAPKGKTAALEIVNIIDPTICYQCKADNGSAELPLIGGLPFCSRCTPALYERPFPEWLKLGMAGLLVLLGFALLQGAKFFKAGKALVLGERLVAGRQYAQAIPHLEAALAIAPDCEKGILLLAKADVLTGRVDEANKLVSGHKGGRFKESPFASDLRQTFARVAKGFGKTEEAKKLYDAAKYDAAARAMREAATLVPEMPALVAGADTLDGIVAFERKDYDRFLQIGEKGWKAHPDSWNYAAALASALASEYAAKGDEAFRKRSEEMLMKARQLAETSPEMNQDNRQFEERTPYRLDSREIIGPEEYDRRFHPEKNLPPK